MPLRGHGMCARCSLVQAEVCCGMGRVWAAELGAEFLSVIVSLFLLCLVTVLIVFLIKTVFWLMPFSVVRPP